MSDVKEPTEIPSPKDITGDDPTINPTKKRSADPLPYIIVFAILFLCSLITLTWVLDVWYKQNQCGLYPNIWCSDAWTCNNTCETGTSGINTCFTQATGLASCLFGPNSAIANTCFYPPTESTGGTGLLCECTPDMQGAPNCFRNCATNFSTTNANGDAPCCCIGGTGCPYTKDNLPAQCKGTNP